MSTSSPVLMLVDTPSLYFRAYYGLPTSMRSPDGHPNNAVRGLLDFFARLISDYRPTHVVSCWDADWRPAFRVNAIPSYKAHRVAADDAEDIPDDLAQQVTWIHDMEEVFGFASCGVAGFEADDVIGTLTARSQVPTRIVTGDRDLFQLVDDSTDTAVVFTAHKGVRNADLVTDDWITRAYGIPPRTYRDFALLRGDPSDGLPGVKGIGEKTARRLLAAYPSLPALMDAAGAEGPPSAPLTANLRAKLLAAADYITVAEPVVTVATDVPIPKDLDMRIPDISARQTAIEEWAARLGLSSPAHRLSEALTNLAGLRPLLPTQVIA